MKLFDPLLVLFQHDLFWWAEYARGPTIGGLLERIKKNKAQAFADDFSPVEPTSQEPPQRSILIQVELTGTLCQLTTIGGPVVAVAIGLVSYSGDSVSGLLRLDRKMSLF